MLLPLLISVLFQLSGGYGTRCFQCFDAADPLACDQSVVCGNQEVCYTRLFQDHNGANRFRLGCEDKAICDLSKTAAVIGKRDLDDDNKCFECCSSYECNSKLCLRKVFHVPTPISWLLPMFSMQSGRWRDCGGRGKWISFNSFDLSPSTSNVNGAFVLSLDATISHQIGSELTVDTLLQKEILGRFTKLVCAQDMGSCHYDDPCHLLRSIFRSSCPAQLNAHGIPCNCPFNPGHFHLPPTTFTIPAPSGFTFIDLRSVLSRGTFYWKITFNDKVTRAERACLELYASFG